MRTLLLTIFLIASIFALDYYLGRDTRLPLANRSQPVVNRQAPAEASQANVAVSSHATTASTLPASNSAEAAAVDAQAFGEAVQRLIDSVPYASVRLVELSDWSSTPRAPRPQPDDAPAAENATDLHDDTVTADVPITEPVVVPGDRRPSLDGGPAAPVFRGRGLGISQPQFTDGYPAGRIAGRSDYQGRAMVGEWRSEDNALQPTEVVYRNPPASRVEQARLHKTGNFNASVHRGGRHGEWLYYQARGQRLTQRAEYDNGERHGTWRQWFADGQKQSEEQFVDGKLHGVRRTWHANGRLESVVSYRSGQREGRAMFWSPDGELIANQRYSQGLRVDGEALPIPTPGHEFATVSQR
ncbi:MAG: hypothetical protein KDA42_10075 [Planctomycetales bacterium]|nr:hypothetical protein [Planctomycetales bacterium]